MRPLIVVTGWVPEASLALLEPLAEVRVMPTRDEAPVPSAELIAREVERAEVLFTLPGHPINASVLSSAPRLRMIATLGTGYDNIDVAAAAARGIVVTNAPGILDETTADLAFGLMLAVARRIPEAERFLRAGRFKGLTASLFAGSDVHGKTLGIVGLGRIGQAMARRARGFGMRLLYTSRSRKPRAEAELGCELRPLEGLLSESDFVSLHVPLTGETRHLIDERALGLMKSTGFLINTSRGPVVDEAALARALQERRIAGAGIDVYEREPLVHPELLACDNAVLLPHIGSSTEETRRRMSVRAAENIVAFLREGRGLDVVTPG